MTDEELKYTLSLLAVPNVGHGNTKNIIAYCGGAANAFRKKKAQLLKIPGVGEKTADSIIAFKDFDEAEKELKFIRKHEIITLSYLDKSYPERLKEIPDAPVLLFYKGNADLNDRRIISIVGTRSITEYGKKMTDKIIAELSAYSAVVVSGLAYGVDIHAHKAALHYGLKTVGVLAHGLDRIYPSAHRNTAAKMIEQGGLISEYKSGTIPDPQNFPTRNRIVAGMADATLIIESGTKGGSLITAQLAYDYNRDVFALPGRSSDEHSSGCNAFIKSQKAVMVESAADIAYNMGWDSIENPKKKTKEIPKNLDASQTRILVKLKETKTDFDSLSAMLQIPASELSLILLDMEFNGYLKSLPGKIYQSN